MLLRLITQKMHVHGLVLHDVIAMLNEDINEENVTYIKEYFFKENPSFKKILTKLIKLAMLVYN